MIPASRSMALTSSKARNARAPADKNHKLAIAAVAVQAENQSQQN